MSGAFYVSRCGTYRIIVMSGATPAAESARPDSAATGFAPGTAPNEGPCVFVYSRGSPLGAPQKANAASISTAWKAQAS